MKAKKIEKTKRNLSIIETLKECLSTINTIPEKLSYLDILEREVNSKIKPIKERTDWIVLKMGYFDDTGHYHLSDSFRTDQKNIYNGNGELTKQVSSFKPAFSSQKELKDFLTKYSVDIKELENLYQGQYELKLERQFYIEQYIKWANLNNLPLKKNSEDKIIWNSNFTDFAFLIGQLKQNNFIRNTHREILRFFIFKGGEKTDAHALADLIGKLNAKKCRPTPEMEKVFGIDKK